MNGNTVRIAAVYLIVLLHVADSSIANVAIYSIARDLRFDMLDGQRIITAFGIGMATAVPFVPRLSEWLGPRAALGWALFASTLSILVCGLAPGETAVVAARWLQGLSSVAVVLLCQRVLLDLVGESQRAFGLSLWTSAIAIAPVIAPVAGALIMQAAGWRALFILQIPMLAACSLAIRSRLASKVAGEGAPPSLRIVAAFGLAAGLLQTAGDRLAQHQLPWWLLGACVLAVGGCVALLRVARQQLFNWRLLAHPVLLRCMSMLATLNGMAVLNGLIYPLWLQAAFHLAITDVAKVLAAGGLVGGVMSPLIGRMKNKERYPLLVALGMVCLALSFAACTRLDTSSSLVALTLPRVLLGLGIGLCSPLGYLAVMHLEKSRVLEANALGMFLRAVVANAIVLAATLAMHTDATTAAAAVALTGAMHSVFAASCAVALATLLWHAATIRGARRLSAAQSTPQ